MEELNSYAQGWEKQREVLRNAQIVAEQNVFRSGTLCETATQTQKRSATQSETETVLKNPFRNAKIPLRNEKYIFTSLVLL